MSELFPTRTIAVEVVSCTNDSRMWEFNYWHDKALIPALRKIRGVAGVYRYHGLDVDSVVGAALDLVE